VTSRALQRLLVGAALLSGCSATPTPDPTPSDPPMPPEITFGGLVTDVRSYAEHHEFTDAAGAVHAVESAEYRQVGEHGCCFDLVILGTDAEGPFIATFPTQDGLPDDCYVENDPGVDRGSYVEILGILWSKAPGFSSTTPFGRPYPPATRFCFDQAGRIAGVIPP